MRILDLFLQSSSVPLLGALVVLLLVYFVSSTRFSSQGEGKEPPGPRPIPVLGNLLQLDLKRPYITLLKLSKKYGSVFTVYLGPQKVVVLAGYKTVKEALMNCADEFGERHPLAISHEENQGYGVIWSNGDSWRDMRRFTLTNLRDFGMGRKACEDKIIEECGYLVEVFKNFKGEPFDTTQSVNYSVSNIICSIVYGSRFEYNDPKFTSMVDKTNRRVELFGSPSMQDSGITNSPFRDESLMMTVQNLFVAGTETTSATLRWGLLLMAKNPEIQDQVQEEISRVIGSRQVQVEDRKKLPFTDAVIHETQRLANIVPLGLPHRTSQDITFQGFFIKKGTIVYPLLTSVLYDESEWEKPHSFHPAHFLDKDGKFVKRDAFMPFSAGRRMCLGEGLARMELFIFFTTLLQRFRFTPPPGVSEDELDLTPRVGFTLNPSPHKLCAVSLM
ncbi:cytochrome P450 2K1-like isoform X3 [Channa argus]|uniref:cytochrome P450 2K1-like isoform X3 n=1 Tax=Channa argus TaxID=215402 RepID=UPI0035216569